MAEGLSRFNNPELNRAQEPPPDTAESLREQIRQHEFIDQHRGLLDRATTNVLNRGDEKSLAALKELEQKVAQGTVKQGEIAAAVKSDRDAMNWQSEVSMYGTGFLKATTLFMPGKGKIPWIAAGSVHAVDQIKIAPDVSAGEVVTDGLLGFGKGAGLKIIMDKASATSWRTWEKGLVIGSAGGALETGMHRENWFNKEGQLALGEGIGRTAQSTLLGAGTGAVTFHVGHKLFKGISAKTGGALEKSGLASNMGVGFSFGVTGGFTGEAMHQFQTGEFDPVKLAVRSMMQGGVDMLAGGTGYKASRLYMSENAGTHQAFSPKEGEGPSLMSQLKGAGERLFKPSESTAESQFSGKTRRRGGDENDGNEGKGDFREQLERLSKQKGWGTPEETGGVKDKGKGEKVEEPVVDETTRVEEPTVVDEGAVKRVVPEAEKTGTKVVPESAELDAAQAALQQRLDALAAEGKLKGIQNMGAMKLYQKLPDVLRQANGDKPIPEMELKVIKDTERYRQLPDMIAEAVRRAEAARATEQKVTEPKVKESETGSDEIVSGNQGKTVEAADRYNELLRRASGQGEELHALERVELSELHRTRAEALEETLSLEDRLAATKRDLDLEQTSKQQAEPAEKKEQTEQRDVVEGPQPPEAFQKGEAVWRNKDNDVPVEVVEYLGEKDGRHYVKVKDVDTGIPLDEIVYTDKSGVGFDRNAGLVGDGKVISMPDINVVAETGSMFGTTYTQGNRLTRRAVNDAYLAVVGEGTVQTEAAARLRQTALDHPELKPALEAIAANHPEIDAVVKKALEGVVAPEPSPEQITLKDIVTRRPDELPALVQEGVDLAVRAAKGEAGAQEKLNEFARRSTDSTEPSELIFDVQEGMMKVARAHPEMSRAVYEAYQNTLSNGQLVEFGTKFMRESVAGDAEATRLLDEFVGKHNHAEVKRGMIDAAKTNLEIADAVYDRYKDALTLDDKFFFGGKYIADATGGTQAQMDRLVKFAQENPEPEVLSKMRLFTDHYPQYRDAFHAGFGQMEGLHTDVPALDAGGKLIDARVATLLGETTEPVSALKFITELSKAIEARTDAGEPYDVAKAAILKNLDLLARLKGVEDTSFLKDAVKEAAWPTDTATLAAAEKLFDIEVASREADRTGQPKPEAANPLELILEINAALRTRVQAGMRVDEAAAALKKNLDRLAKSKGLENADYLDNHIVEAAVPSLSAAEDNITSIGKQMLEAQIADSRAMAEGRDRPSLPDGEQFVRSVWAEMMDYMSKGAKPQPLLDRARARLEIQAALKGEQNANDMLPFLAEAGTFGHESGTRPGTHNLEVNVTPENQVDMMQRVGDFRQIVQNSKLPQDQQFSGTLLERMNQWFEHQMGVRKDLFEWMNANKDNKDLMDYARAYGENTEFSPIAAMIDSYPHMQSRFLSDFPSYSRQLFDPKAKPVERVEEEVPVEQDVPVEGQAQINPTVTKAVENMNSGDGNLQLAGAMESQYLMNPRARGVEQFNRWRQIMEINADRLPPAWKSLFKRPELAAIPDAVLMDFLSANTAQAPARKGGWSWDKDMPEERAKSLEQAIDAFRSADMKDPAKAGDPAIAQANEVATALGIKLATAIANDRPLLNDIIFKIGPEAPFRTQYKQMLTLMLENATSGAEVKGVFEQFNKIQEVRNEYQPRVPRGQPRVEMTQEATLEMMGKIDAIIKEAREIASKTNPSDPDLLTQIVGDLAMGKGQRDETPRKPFGAPGGKPPGGDRGPRPPRQ